MSKVHVLIIDDEESYVRSLSFALRNENMRVSTAHTGEAGISEAERERPDVVLLDLRLPGMDGMATLATLLERYPNMPVIMISAHGDTRAAVQAVKSGAADYLTKPFELDELLHDIVATLDHSRVVQELDYHRRRDIPANGLLGEKPGDRPAAGHPHADCRQHRDAHPAARRVRHRQGSCGPCDPCQQPARRAGVRRSQLRSTA